MSDPVHCERCKKTGRRPLMRRAPHGWLSFEATDEDNPENSIIVCVRSKACADALWLQGPGYRWTAKEMGIAPITPGDTKDEGGRL